MTVWSAVVGMGSRDLWRTSTAWPTIPSTNWKSSVQQGALQCGYCWLDTSLTRLVQIHPDLWCWEDSLLCNSWFLLLQDDFAQNREFITLVVYKTDGKKVYYPGKTGMALRESPSCSEILITTNFSVTLKVLLVLSQLTPLRTSMVSASTVRITWQR